MPKEEKKTQITFDEMQGLVARSLIIANKDNELKFLRNENKSYWDNLVEKYNLDSEINYGIDQRTNTLTWGEVEKDAK